MMETTDAGRSRSGTPAGICSNCKGSGMDSTRHFDEYPAQPHACGYCQGGTYSGQPVRTTEGIVFPPISSPYWDLP